MNSHVSLNICLLPTIKVQEMSIAASQEVDSHEDTIFTLSESQCIPHISLYHVGIPCKNTTQVSKQIKELADTIKPFTVTLQNFTHDNEYLIWDIKNSDSLKILQDTILGKINPLREGFQRILEEEYKKRPSTTDQKIKYLKEFGYPLVRTEFKPHLTISKLKTTKQSKIAASKMKNYPQTFKINAISIGEVGAHGTCSKIFSTFELK